MALPRSGPMALPRSGHMAFLRSGNMALLAVLFIAISAAGCKTPENEAEPETALVVHHAHIYTVDPERPTAEAMAIVNGRIAAIGTNDSILAEYPDARQVDLGGLTVIPGLIDAHAHLSGLATDKLKTDLVGTKSIAEIVERLKTFETGLLDDEWLRGSGWDQNDWPEKDFPTRADLDGAFPNRPVWLERIDGHAAWANSAAIRAAGEDAIRAAPDPTGGHIVRSADGTPTGVFVDGAMAFVGSVVPALSRELVDRGMEEALAEAVRYGLTGVHEAGVGMETVDRFRRFADEDRLPLRIYAMVSPGPAMDAFCSAPLINYRDLLTIRSAKLYLDGALGSRGAALLEDYSDDPGNKGLLFTPADEFAVQVRHAIDCGYQVNTHAIGDRGNRILIDAYEAAGIKPEGRHRDEHTQVVEPSDFERMARLGIIASVQPTHATSDMYWAEDRVGPGRIRGAYAWRTLLDNGIKIALGSDFPVEHVDPLLGFHSAISRQDANNWPEGGWYPDQNMTREEALQGFTIDAAYAAFQEHELGSLSPGKFADFVVLSADIMTEPSPSILETRVVSTWLGGKRVYGDE